MPIATDFQHRAKVLVLGEETRIILPIFRSLGRQGIEVHAAWCPSGSFGLRSRYLHRHHELTPYSPHAREWLADLQVLLFKEKFQLVIPATEAAAYPLHLHRDLLEQLDLQGIFLPNRYACDVAFNKGKTTEVAERIGIAVPITAHVSSAEEIEECLSALRPPLAVKPLCSVNREDVTRKNYVLLGRNREEASLDCRRFLACGSKVVVQEMIAGQGKGIEMLVDEGQVLFAFSHQRLHETSGFGSTYRMSVPLDDRLLKACRQLMDELAYTGVVMVEFRVDEQTGAWALLEVNARFWGSLPLAIASGADFPYFLYQMLVEKRQDFPPGYRSNIRCRNLLDDCRWMWRSFWRETQAGRSSVKAEGWDTSPIGRWQLLKDFGRLLSFQDRLDLFSWSDPAPAVAEAAAMLRILLGKREGPVARVARHATACLEGEAETRV